MAWPKTVPVLTAKDICRERYVDGDKCCLTGHLFKTFEWDGLTEAREELTKVCGNRFITRFNDDPKNRLEDIAKVWNTTMCNLGYTEGNPVKPKRKKT